MPIFVRWYTFLGDAVNNLFVPFPINYNFTSNDDPNSFNYPELKTCNEHYDVYMV